MVITTAALERLGWVAGAAGDHSRAALLLGAADQGWRQIGRVMYGAPQWVRGHDTCAGDARAALGETAFRAAFDRGATLALDRVVADALHRPRPARSAANAPSALTRRERQVAELVTLGRSNRQIAAQLVISTRTAESHVENILRKLGFTARSQIATWMIEQSSNR